MSPSLVPTSTVVRLADIHCQCDEDLLVNSNVESTSDGSSCSLQSYFLNASTVSFNLINVTQDLNNSNSAVSEAFRLDSACNGDIMVNQSSLFLSNGNLFVLWFEATTNGVTVAVGRVLIHLININQAPIFSFPESMLTGGVVTTFSVSEDALIGALVGVPLMSYVSDVDDSAPNASDFSFCCNKTFDLLDGNDTFEVNTVTGQLTLHSRLNADIKNSYLVAVHVTDAGGLSAQSVIEVKVARVPRVPVLSHQLIDNSSFAVIDKDIADNAYIGNTAIYILNKQAGYHYVVRIVNESSDAFKLQFEPKLNGFALLVNNSDALQDSFTHSKLYAVTVEASVVGYDSLSSTATYIIEMDSNEMSSIHSADVLTEVDCNSDSYFLNGSCQSCFWLEAAAVLVATLSVVFAGIICFGWIRPTMASVLIVLDHTQTLALFGLIRGLSNDSTTAGVLSALTMFNFNPSFVFNQCWMTSTVDSTVLFKWISVMPVLAFIAVMAMTWLCPNTLKRVFHLIVTTVVALSGLLLINAMSVFTEDNHAMQWAGGVQVVLYLLVLPCVLWVIAARSSIGTKIRLTDISRMLTHYAPGRQHWFVVQLFFRGTLILVCSVSETHSRLVLVVIVALLILKYSHAMQHRPYHRIIMPVETVTATIDHADETFTVENPLLKGRKVTIAIKGALKNHKECEEDKPVVYRRYGYNEIEHTLIVFQLLTGFSKFFLTVVFFISDGYSQVWCVFRMTQNQRSRLTR